MASEGNYTGFRRGVDRSLVVGNIKGTERHFQLRCTFRFEAFTHGRTLQAGGLGPVGSSQVVFTAGDDADGQSPFLGR